MKLKKLLSAHSVVEMPKEVSHRKNVILTTGILSTFLIDLLSFSIKGAQFALVNGQALIALILFVCYFLRDTISAFVQTFTDSPKNIFDNQKNSYISTHVSNMANIVRGKVFTQQGCFSRIMSNSEVILILKDYITYIWAFWQNIPTAIANVITAIIMAITILITEFMQTQDLKTTALFCLLLIVCIIAFSILYILRFKIRKKYRHKYKELRKENEVLFNDIKNIEPLIKSEFAYRVKLVIENADTQKKAEKEEVAKLNFVQVCRTLIIAGFMIAITAIKINQIGGTSNLSAIVLTDILAISSVYSSILNKVAQILHFTEEIANIIKDAETLYPDFNNVCNVYEQEIQEEVLASFKVESITVKPFKFNYPGNNSVYEQKNKISFSLHSGSSYLVYGPTGCGKSTFMHLLTGKIKMSSSPISYGNIKSAYLASIMHESNGRLGSNPVLEELIFSQDLHTLDKPKMIEILKGTNIYYDILRNLGLTSNKDVKVLDYLAHTTIDQYSSGQKQRLSIVKVLYNLSSHHKIVVFDEATNALDDATAKSVLKFMADYCQRDLSRIVFFVTHQVDLTKEITNGSITFKQNHFPTFEVTASV